MSDLGEKKFKWTHESTSLLVSVWSDNQVQQQLEFAPKPELVWESIARYMKKKGYNVTGKQCKSRIKQVFICYREAKRSGAKGSVEQYYDSIDRVLQNKKNNNENIYSVDTVDAAIKSPSKDVKTNKNLQTRHKFQEPSNCVYRTNALTPTWINERDRDYPDSPESNETVLAQPYRVFSPVRDAATNTRHQLPDLGGKIKRNILPEEVPVKETLKQTHLQNYLNDIPLQNAVQNVQNQIIHENMQQNQALLQQTLLQKRILEQNLMNPVFQPQFRTISQIPQPHVTAQNLYVENPVRVQNQYQQSSANQAVPQEPRRSNYMPNYGRQNYIDVNLIESASPSYSPDNLNDAFCQTETRHNLNETFNQPTSGNGLNLPNIDNTIMTNNATCNDTLSIDFNHDSSSVSDNERPKSKDCSVNTEADLTPSAPFRKKKQQKLEQMMLNAINSQNDVVSKILSAQNDMVNRFLDVDRDRQNRLENRLDNLLDVVRATVLNKSNEKDSDTPHSGEAVITNLLPPPKPGSIPPKLDLVPPIPCRVPCTIANGHVDFINQHPISTRPGVVSPILSPAKKPGVTWTKLGPVSTSPFVRAQQQLGFAIPKNAEIRTKSSAERRIAKDLNVGMDLKTLSLETMALIEVEKQTEEKIENARRLNEANEEHNPRRKLFGPKDPTVAMVLTSAFLDAEKQSEEILESAGIAFEEEKVAKLKNDFLKAVNNQVLRDDVLRGRGEDFDNIKQMDLQQKYIEPPCDSSTPAKFGQPNRNNEGNNQPRQTIQQLAQLVMNSARWRDAASARRPHPFLADNVGQEKREREIQKIPVRKNQREMESNAKTLNWMQDRYSYPTQPANTNTLPAMKNRFSLNGPPIAGIQPLGFVTDKLIDDEPEPRRDYGRRMGFVDELALPVKNVESNDYLHQLKQLYEQHQEELLQKRNGNVIMAQQNDLIKQYVKDLARLRGKGSDSDTDEEFLDTTATMHPPRRGSITSGASSKANKADKCVIS